MIVFFWERTLNLTKVFMKMKMLFKAVAVNIIAIYCIKSANAGSVVYVLNFFFFPGEVLCSQLEESEDVNFNVWKSLRIVPGG